MPQSAFDEILYRIFLFVLNDEQIVLIFFKLIAIDKTGNPARHPEFSSVSHGHGSHNK